MLHALSQAFSGKKATKTPETPETPPSRVHLPCIAEVNIPSAAPAAATAPAAAADGEALPVTAVVVTITGGACYDGLFREVKQEVEGGRVSVYSIKAPNVPLPLLMRLTVPPAAQEAIPEEMRSDAHYFNEGDQVTFAKLAADVASVDPECVVYNFECCGIFSETGCEVKGYTAGLCLYTKFLLSAGYMVMFSDFSLKTLLRVWDEDVLGPKVVEKAKRTISSSMDLTFDPAALKDCPSSQLAAVGSLCDKGTAHVGAMSDTICYKYSSKMSDEGLPFKVDTLTRVTKCDGAPATGLLGHVTLTYPSGGVLLLSCGHWVSLQHLDTSYEALARVAQEQESAEEWGNWQQRYETSSATEQSKMLKGKAAMCVQRSAPCKYKSKSG
eukprot:Rhum_TRINITY_DN18545_c0_g1::Rhum_TRINITY_DN18545_c0_g1_i1::g.167680::m.167680